jgi:hypothetical protein
MNLDLSRINQPDLAKRLDQRPRIILTDARIAEIRSKARTPGYREMLQQFHTDVARMSRQTPVGKFSSRSRPREWGFVLPNLAFAYRLTGNKAYYDEIVARVEELLAAPDWIQNTDLTGSAVLWGMSCVYDWLHSELPSTLKSNMRSRMVKQAGYFYNKYTSIEVPEQLYNNHAHLNNLGLLAAGIALYGDDPMGLKFFALADQHFEQMVGLMPPDGAWHEGIGYLGLALQGMIRMAEMTRRTRGVDYFADSGWFRSVGHFRLHNSIPGLIEVVDFADSPRFDYFGPTYALYRLASIYRDGMLQGFSDELVKLEIEKKRGHGLIWLDLVWYDETVTPVAKKQWQTSRLFDDFGYKYWRTGWDDSAVLWAYKAGPPVGMNHYLNHSEVRGTAHAHPDAGHFVLHAYGKHLIIDDGHIFVRRSTYHNVPLIGSDGYQKGTCLSDRRWFIYVDYFGEPGTARVLKSVETPQYSYVVSELHGAYFAATGPKSLLRYFITLNDGTAIVIDSYELRKSIEYSSFLHTPRGQHTQSGNELKFNAGGDVGFYLKTLSDRPLSVTWQNYAIPADEQKPRGSAICNPEGTRIAVKVSASRSGTIFKVIEPFQGSTSGMRWNAQISGGKLLLTNAGDKTSLTIEPAGADLRFNSSE